MKKRGKIFKKIEKIDPWGELFETRFENYHEIYEIIVVLI